MTFHLNSGSAAATLSLMGISLQSTIIAYLLAVRMILSDSFPDWGHLGQLVEKTAESIFTVDGKNIFSNHRPMVQTKPYIK